MKGAGGEEVYCRDEPVQFHKLPLGIRAVEKLLSRRKKSSVARAKTGYQIFIFCLTFWIYAIYTLTRRPFSVIKIVLCPPCADESFGNLSRTNLSSDEELFFEGWPPFNSTNGKTLLGSVDYSLIFAYAIGLYLSGYVADRVNLRYFLTAGMTGSGVAALFLGLGYFLRVYHLAYFIVFQVFAGFMQSTGWPGLLGITAKWFGKKNRGKVLGVWASCSFVGSILGYTIPSFFILSDNIEDSPWGWAFIVPALIIFSTAILGFLFLVTDPRHLGFLPAIQTRKGPRRESRVSLLRGGTSVPSNERNGSISIPPKERNGSISKGSISPHELTPIPPNEGNDISPSEEETATEQKPPLAEKNKTRSKGVGFLRALLIPGVVEYSLAFFCVKLVVYAFFFWLPFYVAVSYPELRGRQAAWISVMFDVGGIIGSATIGVLSDKLRSRALMIVPMLLFGVPLLFVMRSFGHVSIAFYCLMVLLIGSFISGPSIIIAAAVANDLGTHKSLRDDEHAKSIVSGILDGTGSMGAATGPLLVGVLTDRFGWNTVFYVLMCSTFMSSVFLTRLVITDSRKLFSRFRSRYFPEVDPPTDTAGDCANSAEQESDDGDTPPGGPISARNRTFEEILAVETTL